jgi:putative ABC transport system substrate-binding protein
VRRRTFTIGLLLAAAARAVPAQEPAKQHRIAIIVTGPVTRIHDPGFRPFRAFFEELRRLGDVKGQNLRVVGYSGWERPEGYAELARRVVNQTPDLIVASSDAIARAVRAATTTIPIVWIGGDPITAGLATSLASPGENLTGVTVNAGDEIWGERLQILKEAVPTVSKIGFLTTQTASPSASAAQLLQETSQRLQISLLSMRIEESTPSEVERVFAEIDQERPDAILVSSVGDLIPRRQLIVELVKKTRLPAMYPWRDYVEAGGLMSYGADFGELFRRMADDVHEILNGTKPGDIPIYRPTKFEFLINLKAAKALGLTVPPSLLQRADEVIE